MPAEKYTKPAPIADPDHDARPDRPHAPTPPGPPDADGAGQDKKAEGKKGDRGRILRIALIIGAVLLVLLLIGLIPRLLHGPKLRENAKQARDTTPSVAVTRGQPPPASDDISLPGDVQAVQQTAIVARASGYVQHWYADIGDRVRAGQLLATISTPDLDQQVAQSRAQVSQAQAAVSQAGANVNGQQSALAQAQANAARAEAQFQQARTDLARAQASLAQAEDASAQQRAQLAQAQANLALARVTAQRYQNLLSEGAIDQQTTDQAVASYQSNRANVQALSASLRASRANVRAFASAVGSSRANVTAYAQGVRAGQAAVGAARANISASQAAVSAASGNVRAAQANVGRLTSLQGFNRVVAPFSGVITARNVDAGAFISASGGPSGGGGQNVGDASAGAATQGAAASGSPLGGGSSPGGGQSGSLFSLAQTDALRLYVSVPQTYLGVVRVGLPVDLDVRELPGRKYRGTISRLSGALDAATRTEVTEVRLANKDGSLKPGMFAQVHLRVPHPRGTVLVPSSALVTNANGTQVILVKPDGTLHFQPITLGRDLGKTLEVTGGLSVNDRMVATPEDNLREGEKVKTTDAPPAAQ